MKAYKKYRDYGFFDQDLRLTKLSQLGDPLEKLNQNIDFELFRNILEDKLTKNAKGKGGRPPYDYLMMFKILILQRYYNLSDFQIEYQINDRMSFMRFLNLTISDDIASPVRAQLSCPDSKTVWNFREQIIDLQIVDLLFDLFVKELEKLGLIVNEGKIIDASFVEVPRQRNSKQENEEIKKGQTPKSFDENLNKKSQKDVDARWTQKNKVNFFGYKNHIKADSESKIITKYGVTSANVHDSQMLNNLIDDKDKDENLYADSAYTGQEQEKIIQEKEMKNKVSEKGYKNKPLTEEQKANNKEKSKTRARVEHIFGFMEMSMNSMELNYIGLKRVSAAIGLTNLVYNMFRKIQLQAI